MLIGLNHTHIHSTSGHCIFVWGNLVTNRNKKQYVVACSGVVVKYRALAHGIYEGMRLKRLLTKLKFEGG